MSLHNYYVLDILLDDRDTKKSRTTFAISVIDMKSDKLQYFLKMLQCCKKEDCD